jgi:hypothetical protein
MKIRLILTAAISMLLYVPALSQTFSLPNFGLKSHETLIIRKVELTDQSCKFYLSVENKIANGYFCADKNIFIIYPDGTRSRLVSSENIPVCPETHKFSAPGEKLDFTLTFPPLKPGTEWIDLVEDCNDNCFSFYGVTLDEDLNRKLDEAFTLVDNNEKEKALVKFIEIAGDTGKKNAGIEGFIYVNIISLEKAAGNDAMASQWYARMKTSKAPGLDKYIKYLTAMGITY